MPSSVQSCASKEANLINHGHIYLVNHWPCYIRQATAWDTTLDNGMVEMKRESSESFSLKGAEERYCLSFPDIVCLFHTGGWAQSRARSIVTIESWVWGRVNSWKDRHPVSSWHCWSFSHETLNPFPETACFLDNLASLKLLLLEYFIVVQIHVLILHVSDTV